MELNPLDDRIVIEPNVAEETTAGGIVLPDTAQEKPQSGTVIAVGPGRLLESGERCPVAVEVGEVAVGVEHSLGRRRVALREVAAGVVPLVDGERVVVEAHAGRVVDSSAELDRPLTRVDRVVEPVDQVALFGHRLEELRLGLKQIGREPSDDELQYLLSQVDDDESGAIDKAEFVQFMANLKKQSRADIKNRLRSSVSKVMRMGRAASAFAAPGGATVEETSFWVSRTLTLSTPRKAWAA